MPVDKLMGGIFEIGMALTGIAMLALLIGNANQTAAVVESAGGTFNELLRTVTLQQSGGLSYAGVGRLGR